MFQMLLVKLSVPRKEHASLLVDFQENFKVKIEQVNVAQKKHNMHVNQAAFKLSLL